MQTVVQKQSSSMPIPAKSLDAAGGVAGDSEHTDTFNEAWAEPASPPPRVEVEGEISQLQSPGATAEQASGIQSINVLSHGHGSVDEQLLALATSDVIEASELDDIPDEARLTLAEADQLLAKEHDAARAVDDEFAAPEANFSQPINAVQNDVDGETSRPFQFDHQPGAAPAADPIKASALAESDPKAGALANIGTAASLKPTEAVRQHLATTAIGLEQAAKTPEDASVDATQPSGSKQPKATAYTTTPTIIMPPPGSNGAGLSMPVTNLASDTQGESESARVAEALTSSQMTSAQSALRGAQFAAPPPAAITQIAQISVEMLAGGKSSSAEIRLDPPELGRVSLHVVVEADGVTAIVSAERPETADLMRRWADHLQRLLADAGFGQTNLSFSSQNDSRDREGQTTGQSFASVDVAPALHAASITDRLDLRL